LVEGREVAAFAEYLEMDIAGVREASHKQPFEPFVLRLADGRSLAVPHPDFVALHPRRIIVISDDASWNVVEPLLIVSLEYDAPHKKGSNGSGRRKKPPKN
jgi:hypothetical protein